MANEARATRVFVEILRKNDPAVAKARATRAYVEILRKVDPAVARARVTRAYVEFLRLVEPSRVTSLFAEAMVGDFDDSRVTSLFVEAMLQMGGAGGGESRVTSLFAEAMLGTGLPAPPTIPTPTIALTATHDCPVQGYATAQAGYETGAAWTEATPLTAGTAEGIGLRYSLPVIAFADTSFNRSGIVYPQMQLEFETTDTVTVSAYLDTTQNPAVFSGTNLPSAGGTLLGTTTTAGSGTETLSLDIGLFTAQYRAVGWLGFLNLSLFTTSGTLSTESVTLAVEACDEDGGLLGIKWQGGGPIREDPKTEEWFREDDGVRDGYLRDELIHPRNWDPEDRERLRRARERRRRGR